MTRISDPRGVWVKICGLTRPDDVDAAVKAGASAIGLVFAISPRQLSLRRAAQLRERVPEGVTVTGVFDSPSRIARAVSAVELDAVQVPTQIQLPDLPDHVTVLRTVRMIDDEQLASELEHLDGHALHIDSHVPGQLGGTGVTAPWDDIAKVEIGVEWVLSGGLNPSNVGPAVRRLGPDGVDVSSGVEDGTPGVKSIELISEFIHNARNL